MIPQSTVPAGETSTAPRRRPVGPMLGIVLGVLAVQALLFTLFAWPALHSAPRELRVDVAGQPAAARQFAAQLDHARPGAFDVRTVPDQAAGDAALRDRDAYGVFVVAPDGVRLRVASAASPQVAALLGQVAQSLGQKLGHPVPVTDVVPADPDDRNGVVLSLGILPLAMTSLAAGVLLALRVRGRLARLAGVVLFAALAGLVSTAIARWGLSALPGDYLTDAAGVALLALAVSGTTAGLAALLGPPGAGLGVLVIFVLGIPLSGLTSAPDLLPDGWGTLGQYLPPGAGGTLLRSLAYFDGAATGRPLAVLSGWAAVGIVLLVLARPRAERA